MKSTITSEENLKKYWEKKSSAYNAIFDFLEEHEFCEKDRIILAKLLANYLKVA